VGYNLELTKEQKQKLKSIQLELLKILIMICNQEGIRYFAIGGTALGAVRHKGFIPWDDDIDIGMPRKDYEKFISIAQEKLPSYLFLQSFKTEKAYLNGFSKIRDSRTTFLETAAKELNINHGVYLDIFPLDGHPKSIPEKMYFYLKKKCYDARISLEYYDENERVSIKSNIKTALRLLYPDCRKVIAKRDAMYKRFDFDKSEYVANFYGAWGKKEVMPKLYFGEGTAVEFEGFEVVIPENYDQYLKNVYGDYMTLPPVEKRVSHHYCEIIDLETPYTEYQKDVSK